MKTLIKWLVIICALSWGAHNPAAVSTDIGALMGAGQSVVSSLASAVGSGISGVSSGLTGGTSAPAAPVPAPAAPSGPAH